MKKLPNHACDCHVHIFNPEKFSYSMPRTYTPGSALVSNLLTIENQIGIERVVLVQPSTYAEDNRALLDALQQLGLAKARGIVVIDPKNVRSSQLQDLESMGVRGIRLNLETSGQRDTAVASKLLKEAASKVAHLNWLIQLYADIAMLAALAPVMNEIGCPVLLDHFAGVKVHKATEQQKDIETVLNAAQSGNINIKLSAPYRVSRNENYADVEPLLRRLIETLPNHVVWGSDWPHTGSSESRSANLDEIEPFRNEDAGKNLNQLIRQCKDGDLDRILVSNPARLFRFE
ncbi:MAG TPA: amidohydrolase family protein [Candidatus Eremiobacteraceae bacterium]|nr:amidohydrolase family protein [Candidatus Eremiobacteraceae bacterium]